MLIVGPWASGLAAIDLQGAFVSSWIKCASFFQKDQSLQCNIAAWHKAVG